MKNKYPFLIRLLGLPALIILLPLLMIILLVSDQKFGYVLAETGMNFLKEKQNG